MKKNYFAICLSVVCVFFVEKMQSQTVEKLSSDQFEFIEGPVWDGEDHIYFTDIGTSTIHKYSLSSDAFSVGIENTNQANGLMFNNDGDLIVCEGGIKSIRRRSIDGTVLETMADTFNGLEFNKPNDLCIDKRNGIYFTDPSFGSTTQTQGTNRLYYRKPNGNIIALDDFGDDMPNGVIISPDGAYLYVSNTWSQIVKRYDIKPNGNVINEIDFATLEVSNPNANSTGADGMAVDNNGNLYVTSKLGVQVFDISGGSPINIISIPDQPTNCTFGGVNKDILFVTARTNFYKIELPGVTGIRHPFDLPSITLNTSDLTDLSNKELKLFPNPLEKKSFLLELATNYKVVSLYISDALGKQISQQPLFSNKGKQIEVVLTNSLTSGVYFVTINTDKGRFVNKLIIP